MPSPRHPNPSTPHRNLRSQLRRREPHRMEALAWPTGALGIRPHPSSSASTRSKYEPRAANRLDHVVHQQALVLPNLEELSALGILQQPCDACSSGLPPVIQLLEKLAVPRVVLRRLVVLLLLLLQLLVLLILSSAQGESAPGGTAQPPCPGCRHHPGLAAGCTPAARAPAVRPRRVPGWWRLLSPWARTARPPLPPWPWAARCGASLQPF